MRKGLIKRAAAICMAAVMAASMAGCGSNKNSQTGNEPASGQESQASGGQEGQVTLNVWHQWANDTNELKGLYEQAVKEYEEENPNVKINSQSLDTEAYKTKIAAEFAGNAKGIDVFYYWGAGMARKLVNADKLLPLDDYLTEDALGRIKEGSLSAFQFDGKTYSLPTFSWYMTLFCNQELFDQAGAKIPTTYEELLDAVEKLSQLDGITPLVSGAKDGWNAGFIYEALALRSMGAEAVNKMLSGETPFEGQGYQDAADKVVELYNAGAFGKNPLETGSDDADAAFVGGKAGMRIMGSWFANTVYNDPSSVVQDKVTAAKIPMIEGSGKDTDYAGGYIESFWVNKNTKYQEEAAKFAIYINEKMGKYAYETGTGFCGWDVETDDTKINALFKQISQLLDQGVDGVLAWDTSLDANPASIHLEQVQSLFAPGSDTSAFIEEHQSAINK